MEVEALAEVEVEEVGAGAEVGAVVVARPTGPSRAVAPVQEK